MPSCAACGALLAVHVAVLDETTGRAIPELDHGATLAATAFPTVGAHSSLHRRAVVGVVGASMKEE